MPTLTEALCGLEDQIHGEHPRNMEVATRMAGFLLETDKDYERLVLDVQDIRTGGNE